MYANGRMFPPDYYKCTATLEKKKERWFCNRPLSPVQAVNITSSDDLGNKEADEGTIPKTDFSFNPEADDLNNYVSKSIVQNADSSSDPEKLEAYEDSDDQELSNSYKESDIMSTSSESSDSVNDPTFVADEYSESETDSSFNEKNFKDDDSDFDVENAYAAKSARTQTQGNADIIILEDIKPSTSTMSEVPGKIKRDGQKRKGNKGKDFCPFCDELVLNFARHVTRNHQNESDVKKICFLKPKSKERQLLLAQLRKQGNYMYSSFYKKPIKKRATEGEIILCSNCMGYYSSQLLWRHRKTCIGNSDNKRHKSEAQNILIKGMRIDKQLIERVFPRMQADRIALVAKQDSLICAYGARYIKIHREQHFEVVASRKMRELARLLIELRKLKPDKITSLFSALNPKYFSLFVEATKIVAKYDPEKQMYHSGTYALNIATSIKQCCDIALLYALQKKSNYATISTAKAQARLKSLSEMIKEHWKFEVSNQAANDVSMKKWNKVTIVPLASDLKLLKEHLISEAKKAIANLEMNSSDKKAYITLLETVYCRLILFNRRRPGELQRLKLNTYTRAGNTKNYEEFSEAVTLTEKILMKTLKRIVIKGKRGKGVPVLFSVDVQKHIDILIKFRENFIKDNIYLFANINTNGTTICGYKALHKYAVSCGAKHAEAISSTKLRKHLATLSQLFDMSENDVEQLATFMGHTVGIHRGSYRLPNDVFETAKISKILLLMEKGEAGVFKGKTLDEIQIDFEEDLTEQEEVPNSIIPLENTTDTDEKQDRNESKKKDIRPKIVRTPWTDEQKNIVRKHFQSHINSKKAPKKQECELCREKYQPILENKNWVKIKVFVQNCFMKKMKN